MYLKRWALILPCALVFLQCSATRPALRNPAAKGGVTFRTGPEALAEYGDEGPYAPDTVPGDDENSCKGFPKNLRSLFFDQFFFYALANDGEMTDAQIRKFSLRMGRVMATSIGKPNKEGETEYQYVGESNGDSANIHDAVSEESNDSRSSSEVGKLFFVLSDGETIRSSQWDDRDRKRKIVRVLTTLSRWNKMLSDEVVPETTVLSSTDVGILQISANQLMMDLNGKKVIKPGMNFLPVHRARFGPEDFTHLGDAALDSELDLGSVNRGYVDTYRNIAYSNVERGLRVCGTERMFQDSKAALMAALDNLVHGSKDEEGCRPCTVQLVEDKRKVNCKSLKNVQCFVRWASLCPNLNLDIGMSVTDGYFGTKELDSVEYDEDGMPERLTGYGNGNGRGRCYATLKSILKDVKAALGKVGN